jgi:hypothetical protein
MRRNKEGRREERPLKLDRLMPPNAHLTAHVLAISYLQVRVGPCCAVVSAVR